MLYTCSLHILLFNASARRFRRCCEQGDIEEVHDACREGRGYSQKTSMGGILRKGQVSGSPARITFPHHQRLNLEEKSNTKCRSVNSLRFQIPEARFYCA